MGKLQYLRLVGRSRNLRAGLILTFMVVGRESDASQVAVGIVHDMCLDGIEGYRLEDSLHGLLCIHGDSSLCVG